MKSGATMALNHLVSPEPMAAAVRLADAAGSHSLRYPEPAVFSDNLPIEFRTRAARCGEPVAVMPAPAPALVTGASGRIS